MKLLNKAANNVLLLALIAFLVSICCYTGFLKIVPIVLVSLMYFFSKKEIISLKNNLIFSLIFSFLRLATVFLLNTTGFFFSFHKFLIFSLFDFLLVFFGFYLLNLILYVLYGVIKNKRIEFPEVKIDLKKIKVVLVLIGIVLLCCLIIQLPKYRFGYFTKGPELQYRHGATPIKLDNGNVFISGINNSVTLGKYKYIPAEIYDTNTNTFKILDMPKDIIYSGACLPLKGNRILFLNSYKPENINNHLNYETAGTESRLLTQMIIFNLNTMQIEKIIDKKIVKEDKYYSNTLHSELLGNGQFLIINSEGKKYIEIFDLDKGTSKLLKDNKTDILLSSKIISYGKDYVLIFNENGTVEKFDSINEKTYKVGNFLPRKDFSVFKIDEENIVIVGGKQYAKEGTKYVFDIELYNAKTNTSEVIGKLIKDERKNRTFSAQDAGVNVIGDYIIIVGGNKPYYNSFSYIGLKSVEVINYKTHKQYKIANMPFAMHSPDIIKLSNGDLLITNSYTRSILFKNLIRRKKYESN